jgi:hypothetical protein
MMKTLLSTVAALAVMTVAGAALAQDPPAGDTSAPAKHHHAKHHKAMDAADKGDDSAGMKGRTDHGGPPSSPREKAETEKLNDQQLGGSH